MPRRKGSWHANILNAIFRAFIFLALLTSAILIYRTLLRDILHGDDRFMSFVLLWVFSAYIAVPRAHRYLTYFYLPDYFIGRARTRDGLYGDLINIAIDGTEAQLRSSMKRAGWILADPVGIRSSLKILTCGFLRRSYPNAPVSSLFLFGRKQELAFQQEINGNPLRRHHVRFWKTDENWWLPGGKRADWLGAATFDRNVGLSLFTGQLTHKIDSNVDLERDYVVLTLKKAKAIKKLEVIKHFVSGFHGRNGGGDRMLTDGSLPFLTLNASR